MWIRNINRILLQQLFQLILAIQISAQYFPADISACTVCQQNYSQYSQCSSIFANWNSILLDPLDYPQALQCICTDSFQYAYSQCLTCFLATNQTVPGFTDVAPPGVDSIRSICQVFGKIVNSNETSTTTSATSTTSTTTLTTSVPSETYTWTFPSTTFTWWTPQPSVTTVSAGAPVGKLVAGTGVRIAWGLVVIGVLVKWWLTGL